MYVPLPSLSFRLRFTPHIPLMFTRISVTALLYCVYSVGSNTYCIICGSVNVKVKNYLKSEKYNIARLDWLRRCLSEHQLIPWYAQFSKTYSVENSH